MKTLTVKPLSTARLSSSLVHGPQLAGVGRALATGLWAALFLTCLAAAAMSIGYMDLWHRTPYTELPLLDARITPEGIQQSVRPFQEAIRELGLSLDLYSHYFTGLRILAGLPFFVLSALIVRRRSDRLMAVLFAIALSLAGAAGTLFNPLWEWIPPHYPWHPVLNQVLGTLLYCSVIILFIFPDGRFVPRWTRWLAVVILPYALLNHFGAETSPLNPDNWPGPLAFGPHVAFIVLGASALLVRYRQHADPVQKQQIKWVVFGITLLIVNLLVDNFVWWIYPSLTGIYLIQAGQPAVLWELFQDSSWYAAQLTLAVCIAVSVFRYRLWDIDLVINRILVYGSLTALTMLLYLAVVSAMGSLFSGLANETAFFLATGLVAILFEPLRQRLQRAVNRLMYGKRDDPYSVLAQLSGAVQTTYNPEDILPALAAQIGRALKIPYVALYLEQNGEEQLAASSGTAQTGLLAYPLVYQEQVIGSLRLARRAAGEEFAGSEQRLIENITRQASAAAQAVRLHKQLVRSRAQIVAEREEERRRIRRDLHDELGPILASQSLKLAAAREMIRSTPEKAEDLVDEVALQSQNTVKEIRRLVHGLRPPALDQLGLVEAVRDFVRGGWENDPARPGLTFEIRVTPDVLPALPAAVEVNAYRIVLEALSNAERHAQAQYCAVDFSVETASDGSRALVVQVCDNGRGFAPQQRPGIGLRSMRERAEEIGGTFKIASQSPRGTCVTAWLPL